MKKVIWVLCVACLFTFVKNVSATPPDLTILGTFHSWTAYSFQETDGKVCYMAAEPTKSAGKYTYRGDVFLSVTHRPNDKSYDVVSIQAGFTYKKGTKPTLRVDNRKTVNLEAVKDMAWVKEAAIDKKLVQDMIKGGEAVAYGQSVRGTKITDTFSLKGFTKAYEAINEACGR